MTRSTRTAAQARPARQRTARLAAVAALALALAGCAATRGPGKSPGERLDPWENWNRKVFNFNEKLDENILEPVATGYSKVVPRPVRVSVGNFFANIADAWSAVNNLLQGKPEAASRDIGRFTMNTLFGVFGFLDVASEAGIDHQYEDFGQTLGHWGVPAGAYIVWPLLGPSTVRETAALPLDRAASPALLIDNGNSALPIFGLQLINTRANLLNASRVLDDIALDKYTFVRDAYLQRRRSLVYDGDEPPPREPDADPGAAAAPLPPAAAAATPLPPPAAALPASQPRR